MPQKKIQLGFFLRKSQQVWEMHWSLLRGKPNCPMVTGYYIPGQREIAGLPKKSGQTEINVYGGEELPLLLLKKQSCSEDFSVRLFCLPLLIRRTLTTSTDMKVSLAFHVCRVLPSLPVCSAASRTAPPPNYPQEHPHATLLHLCILSQCNVVIPSQTATWTSFGPKASMKNH